VNIQFKYILAFFPCLSSIFLESVKSILIT
jgi:hypothetical protein